jgi:hypothetical protein
MVKRSIRDIKFLNTDNLKLQEQQDEIVAIAEEEMNPS